MHSYYCICTCTGSIDQDRTQSLDQSQTVPKLRQGWAQLPILYTYWSGGIEQDPISGSIPNCPQAEARVGTSYLPCLHTDLGVLSRTRSLDPSQTVPRLRQGWAQLPIVYNCWSGSIEQDPISGSIPNCPQAEAKVGSRLGHSYLSCILTGLEVSSRTRSPDPFQTVPRLRQGWAAGWQNPLSRCPGLEGAGGGNCRTYVISIFWIV